MSILSVSYYAKFETRNYTKGANSDVNITRTLSTVDMSPYCQSNFVILVTKLAVYIFQFPVGNCTDE